MTTAITMQGDMTPERVDRDLEWLKRSLPSLREDQEVRRQAKTVISSHSKPAHPAEISARVLALLNSYYDKDSPVSIQEIEAEDWVEALKNYPYWAIERACRWWKSDENGYRRKRPLEGDIVDRCKVHMQPISAAKIHLQADLRGPKNWMPD